MAFEDKEEKSKIKSPQIEPGADRNEVSAASSEVPRGGCGPVADMFSLSTESAQFLQYPSQYYVH